MPSSATRRNVAASVRGPANPSLNDSAGLLVHGFDEDPYILMPYNPAAYASYLERAGYYKAKDLLAWDLDTSMPLGERVRVWVSGLRRGTASDYVRWI